MKESFSNSRKIDDLKPQMTTLEDLELLKIIPDQTVVIAKVDGEFNLLSYTKEGESYVLNKWGHRREDFLALNQFIEAMNKTNITHAELLCELYAKEDGKPTNLPTFIHLIKGDKDLSKIHIGVWDLIKINGYAPKEPFSWRLEEVERWLKGCTHASVIPYIKPKTVEDVKAFWKSCIEEKGYEGLVIRNGDQIYKIKPCLDVDAVIIGLNKTSSYGRELQYFQKGQVTSIKLALMQSDGTFIELSDCASGITADIGTTLFKLMDYKVGEDDTTVYVKPIVVCTIEYTETYVKSRRILKFENGKYVEAGLVDFVSLRHPRLKRFRPDKTVNPSDLRVTQIPRGKPLEFILHCGDCRQVLPTLTDESIDLIITSPPYYRQAEYSGLQNEIGVDTPDKYKESLLAVFKECYRILKSDGLLMLNIDNGRREDGVVSILAWDFIKPLEEMGFTLTQTIIWVDHTRRPLKHPRLLDHHYEPIFVLAKGKDYTWNWQEANNKNDIWEITHYKGYVEEKGDVWDRTGVASFPVALIEDLIILGSNAGDWTLDMFAGSGTVMDVAQRLGRNNISIEISESYCETIMKRCFDKDKLHRYAFIKGEKETHAQTDMPQV